MSSGGKVILRLREPPLTSLVCAPFHCRISLGMNDLAGRELGGGGAVDERAGRKTEGVVLVGCMSYPAGQFSNLMRNQM